MTANGCPWGATTAPAAPLTSAGRTHGESRAKLIARSATARAPRTTAEPGRRGPRVGAQHDIRVEDRDERVEVALRGTRRRRRRRPRAGAARSASGTGRAAPCTRRRARLASCRAAVGERPTIGAISSNGTANMSCSTNASRSAGVSVSSTTSSASPTESASSASCSGSAPSARLTIGSGTWTSSGSSRRVRARAQHVQAHAGDDRRQPRRRRFSTSLGVRSAEPQPGLLDGVVGLARASPASGRRPPAGGSAAPRSAPPANRARPPGHIPSSCAVKGVTDEPEPL